VGLVTVAMGERSHHLPVAIVILSSNKPCDVTVARCYCDWALLSVTQSSDEREVFSSDVATMNLKLLQFIACEIPTSLWHEMCEQSLGSN
jgi:hypothetical protein